MESVMLFKTVINRGISTFPRICDKGYFSRAIINRAIINGGISTRPKLCDKKILSQNIKYTESQEWLYYHQDFIKMGLTKKATDEMGELVYLEFSCEKGDVVKENEELVNIESVKTAESINAPYDCVILGTNNKLTEPDMNLDTINKNPEQTDNSWIIKIDRIP